ncbi:MAG: hypothetical protein IPP69_13500 [Flavobacteriales bacterium]|nr:hypothetical protein [Flavobacteriales bacterium]
MKKILFTSAVALTLIACGGSGTENKEATKSKPKKQQPQQLPIQQLILITKTV